MGKIQYRKRKLGQSCLVWFQNSNLYFYLEEPAWYVFRKVVKRHKSESIAKEFDQRYGAGYNDSLSFVVELRKKIQEMNQPHNSENGQDKIADKINKYVYAPYSSHFYKMQNNVIKFSYETPVLENYIHPLVKHLETTGEIKGESHFELFMHKSRIVLKVDDVFKGSWTKDESGYVKGKVFAELLNVLYDKTEADWLMTVHASAVSNGRKTILFSASAGSGKSTFAALLQTQGYHIISDDFVPIEQSTFKAYPLPVAMSVKEGSLDLLTSHYPELNENPLIEINSQKKIKYLPVDAKKMNMIFPVNEFVFIKYDNSVDLLLEKTGPVKALKQLLEESWIPPTPENVAVFLNKIPEVSFYNLTYSDNQKAMEAINQLFENDPK